MYVYYKYSYIYLHIYTYTKDISSATGTSTTSTQSDLVMGETTLHSRTVARFADSTCSSPLLVLCSLILPDCQTAPEAHPNSRKCPTKVPMLVGDSCTIELLLGSLPSMFMRERGALESNKRLGRRGHANSTPFFSITPSLASSQFGRQSR